MADEMRQDREMKAEIRLDAAEYGKTTITPEGWLRTTAVVARTGVQEYDDGNGGVRRELRDHRDVFAREALDSLKMLPVTNDHPAGSVTAVNAKKLQVGMTGEDVRPDGAYVVLPLVVTDADAIKAIQDGRRELSVGYSVTLVAESGVYDGIEYTHRQTNIRANHVALVDRARAGGMARIHLDGKGKEKENHMDDLKLTSVRVDGLEYKAAPEVAKYIEKLDALVTDGKADLAKLKDEYEKVKATADEMAAKIKDMEKELEEAKDKKKSDAALEARLSLIEKVRRIKPDIEYTGKSDRDIMSEAIQTKHDGLDLSEKSDAYVEARFDAMIEALPAKALEEQKKATKPGLPDTKTDAESARKDAEDHICNAWKGKKG